MKKREHKKQRKELESLRAENEILKQASSWPLLASGPGILASPVGSAGANSLDHGESQNQLKHFRGWTAVAVNCIANRVSGARLCVGVKSRGPRTSKSVGNDLEPLDSHPLLDALADPNPDMTQSQLIWLLAVYYKICGLAYLWVHFDEDEQRLKMWPLPPHWVRQKGNIYEVRPDGAAEPKKVPAEEMAVLLSPHPLNPYGNVFSMLSAQADVVNVDEAILASQSQAFSQGIHPSVILRTGSITSPDGVKMQRNLTPEQRKQLIEAMRNAYNGVVDHHKPLILDGLIESVEKFSLTPAELDWLKSAEWSRDRILMAWGVNPTILGSNQNANRAQAAVAEQNFASNVTNPLLEQLGVFLTAWIAKPLFGENVVVFFEKIKARDAELELQQWSLLAKYQAVTKNELRRCLANLPDIEGGDELPEPTQPVTSAAQDELDKLYGDYLRGADDDFQTK